MCLTKKSKKTEKVQGAVRKYVGRKLLFANKQVGDKPKEYVSFVTESQKG